MKSYGRLWEQFTSEENYYLAVKNATMHKGGARRKYRRARYYRDHADELKPRLMNYAKNFKSAEHVSIEIYDGVRRKKRNIVVPTMDEQVVHHMVINVLKPIFMRSMYEHSYGSIPGRGAHLAKKRMQSWIRHGGKNCKYVLKMDVRKFFDTVPHSRLKQMLHRIIRDDKFLAVVDEIIDAGEGDRGIPIGFYTSQWFANFYLTGLDHFIKETLGAKYYMRYMDDMVILGPNKRTLHKYRREIERYLNCILDLEMRSNWQVFLFDFVKRNGKRIGAPLDFMGFQFFRDRVVLRKTIVLKASRKARRMAKKPRRTVYDARQVLSYLGWLSATDTYGMFRKWIKPFVNIQRLKRQVGNYQRRQNRRVANVAA